MPSGESVTIWIQRLKVGERDAVQKLWQGYFTQLVEKTRQWLRHAPATLPAEAEDVALSAFDSFCRRAEQGQFPRRFDRTDLWQLLLVIAFRKVCTEVKREARRQPRTGRLVHASALGGEGTEEPLFTSLIGRELDPALVAQTADECRRLLALLRTEELRAIAVWKMEGFTDKDIAVKIGRSLATVERKLALIRKTLAKDVER